MRGEKTKGLLSQTIAAEKRLLKRLKERDPALLAQLAEMRKKENGKPLLRARQTHGFDVDEMELLN